MALVSNASNANIHRPGKSAANIRQATTANLRASARIRMAVRLKLVATADFRRGIPYHIAELRRTRQIDKLGFDEVALLISQTGLQIAFVFPEIDFDGGRTAISHAISHYRIQLAAHTPWDPKMLSVYADEAGIEIIGIKRFEEHFAERYRELAKKREAA